MTMLPLDKIAHFETSALLVVVLSKILSFLMVHPLAMVIASFVTLALGFGKEYYDYASKTGKADRKDFRADVIGVLMGVILSI